MKEEMKAREKRLNAILKNHGICVEWIESVKNNQTLDGYVIKKEGESLSPILYYTPTWYEKTDFEVVADCQPKRTPVPYSAATL